MSVTQYLHLIMITLKECLNGKYFNDKGEVVNRLRLETGTVHCTQVP